MNAHVAAPTVEDASKRVYARYIELLNAQDFDSLSEVVDADAYHEICVGFTPGWVNLADAITSLKRVVVGIPDLRAEIMDCVAEGNKVYARLTVTGTNTGRFFGLPASGCAYEVNMFDYARIEDGKIVERIQQSDTLSQLRQMYASAAKKLAVAAGAGFITAGLFLVVRRR